MLAEIKELHRRLGFTALYVTHDQEQAMRLADRIMVMNQGSIEQIGTPEEVYLNPSTLFVAKFVGDINLVRGKVASLDMNEKRVEVETEVGTFLAPIREGVTVGDPVAYAVRPEKPLIGKDAMNCANKFHAKLKDRIYKGSNVEYVFELPNGDEFKVVLAEELEKRVEIGEEAILGCRIEDSVVISKSSVIEGLDIDRVTLGE
jgi:ABC-type Fe3+/spermidine/putrescine transport system ATPase subunit